MAALIDYLAKIGSLFRKEMLALVKDPANRALLFMPALLQALLFGYGATYDLTHVPYAVLDQSRGAASTELLAKLDGTGVFERVATLTSSGQIAGMIDSGDALLVVSIPSDFEARLASGQQAPLQVILDGRNSSTAGSAARRVYLEGAGLSDVAFDFVPLLAVAAFTLPLAAWLFRNRLS